MISNDHIKSIKINKNLIVKILKNFKFKIFQTFLFIPSILLLLVFCILFKTILKKNQKLISLRISTKYFGHFSIEPAILSAYCSNQIGTLAIASIKKEESINNKILEHLAKTSFHLKNDSINYLLENIYHYSFKNIKEKINKFYSPLLPQKLKTREMSYIHLLDSDKSFKWRSNAQKIIFNQNGNDFKLIIALRTEHYNKRKKNVASQPWRNASAEDIEYLCKVFSKIIDPKKIFLFYHPENSELLKKQDLKDLKINFVDETKIDILSLLNSKSILVNNGNGIGAAALAIGVKTLYVHHTLWHFWHTSHANALCLPSLFINPKQKNKSSFENLISLAFSPKNNVPFNFLDEYYAKGIKINKIIDINEEVLTKTLLQILSEKDTEGPFKSNYMGCYFEYLSKKEEIFWKTYIKKIPPLLRQSHRLIKLKISKSFLDSMNN